jgi:bla regulator protein blaR1
MILDHLWQSSLFVVLVWVLTLTLRRNRAAVRYWLWLAASVKFLVPFAVLVSVGSQFGWRTAPFVSQPQVSFVMEEMSRASVAPIALPVAAPAFNFAPVLLGIWFCGFAIGVVLWMRSWLHVRGALRAGRRNRLPHMPHLPIRISATRIEPGVFGIFRPVLLLPEGIADRLTPPQVEAILAHELCHVRRRDNLTAAIHMVVETIFWFHPMVWWIRARLIDERERACDEEVLRMGNEAEVYAASILEACKLYLESPLVCVSGVTGSDLKKRIEAIMANRHAVRVNFSKKLLLAVAAIGAVMGPVAVGVLNAPPSWAQSHAEFDVATVKLVKPGTPENRKITASHGTLMMEQQTLSDCIAWAYNLTAASEITGPEWIESEKYDIAAKASETATQEELRAMLQTLLAEKFKLTIRHKTEQRPLYALVVGKGGPKLHEVQQEPARGFHVNLDGSFLSYHMVTSIPRLAEILPGFLDQPLLDKTGLKGVYDFTLRVEMDSQFRMPEVGQPFHGFGMTPSIFGAVEALGLKLVSEKGPVDVLVVDHAERPSENDQAFFKKALWTPQEFEVASVKPSPPDATDRSLGTRPGGRLSTENATVKQLIYFAYDVMPFQVSGGPDWVGSAGFDIEAKPADPNASKEQVRQMVQKLLAERFRLKFHMETKEMPIYALAVGRRGSKLVEDHSENTHVNMTNSRGEMTGVKATMPMLASSLSRVLPRQVMDETGLKGTYSFKLQFLPDQSPPRPDEDGASIFTALQEQLGLSLKAGRGPVEVLVVDSAEKPSGN